MNNTTNIRYVATHLNKSDMRQMTFSMQGRHTHPTEKEAQDHLNAIIENTAEDTIKQCYGDNAIDSFEIRPVECYSNNDPKGMYFDDAEADKRTGLDKV